MGYPRFTTSKSQSRTRPSEAVVICETIHPPEPIPVMCDLPKNKELSNTHHSIPFSLLLLSSGSNSDSEIDSFCDCGEESKCCLGFLARFERRGGMIEKY